MKALVTGGGGFLGRYIVEQLLKRGDSVTIFARGAYPEVTALGAVGIRGDLTDPEAVRSACIGMDAVFHVAAFAGQMGPWKQFFDANVAATRNVIRACVKNEVPRLVYTSSPSVVFANEDQHGVDESVPYPDRYESYYDKSKAIAEKMVLEANGPRLLTCALRPHLIFGPRDPHLLTGIARAAKAGRLPVIGDGNNWVDFVYVEDAARAHLLAVDALKEAASAPVDPVYFISQDEPVQLYPFLNDLFRRLDIPPVRKRMSLKTARTIGAVWETAYRIFPFLSEPRLTRTLASKFAMSHYYDISRAKKELGYRPRYAMDQAIDKTLDYLRAELATK